jgi:pimeloyl-ACP methyl ester carboxylesterase
MRRAVRVWCVILALALPVAGPGALVAAGDDGPSRPGPTDHPTRIRTILRPTEISEPAPRKQSAKEVIIVVGGVNSSAQDPTFDALQAMLFDDPGYEVHRFGADPAYPYDTLGSLDVAAGDLTNEIRDLGLTHPAVHIVAHSMGGAVVDRAFANGLSAKDGVATYTALSSPHSGSASLAAIEPVLERAGDTALELRALFSAKLDVGSAAAHDLAHAKPVPPPAGVTRFDLRIATDWAVTSRDAADPGVESRTLVPADIGAYLDGHGAITRDSRALDLVMTTIATRAIPADTRSEESKRAADLESLGALGVSVALCVVGLAVACAVAFALRRTPPIRWITRPLAVGRLREIRRK